MDGGRGDFTISTKPSEGTVPPFALAFKVGVVLGSILGAGWTVFSKRTETRSVAAVGADSMVGMLCRMPTGVAMVREKKKDIAMGFMLELCALADYLFNSEHRWN